MWEEWHLIIVFIQVFVIIARDGYRWEKAAMNVEHIGKAKYENMKPVVQL
jgi:hypothetical protein